jgi:hypothetical protein
LLGIAWATSACGVKDLDFTFLGSVGGQGGKPSAAGGNHGAGDGGAADPGVPFTCHAGERRCKDNTPEECSEDGAWVSERACSGNDKVCTGAGVCAAYLLVSAGIDALGMRPTEPRLVLKRQTLASAKRSCSATGICVTGAIR